MLPKATVPTDQPLVFIRENEATSTPSLTPTSDQGSARVWAIQVISICVLAFTRPTLMARVWFLSRTQISRRSKRFVDPRRRR